MAQVKKKTKKTLIIVSAITVTLLLVLLIVLLCLYYRASASASSTVATASPTTYYQCQGATCSSCGTTQTGDCQYTTSDCDGNCALPSPTYYQCQGATCSSCGSKQTSDCKYTTEDCDAKCSSGPSPGLTYPLKVLYTYHLFEVGNDPGKSADPSQIKTILKSVIDSGYNIVNLSFYQYGSVDEYSAFGHLSMLSAQDQKEVVDYAHQKNVKLFVSAGGAVGTASFAGVPYTTLSKELYDIVTTMNLDGVDIDVEATNLFPMIAALTNDLAAKFQGTKYISHAPQSANFGNNTGQPSDYFTVYDNCGSNIDFLNVQFYNQGCPHMTYPQIFTPYQYDCWNMVWISTGYQKCDTLGCKIPLNKLVVGKPIELGTYGAANGFVDAATLHGFFQQAALPEDQGGMNWNTGLMVWEYDPSKPDAAKNYVSTTFINRA